MVAGSILSFASVVSVASFAAPAEEFGESRKCGIAVDLIQQIQSHLPTIVQLNNGAVLNPSREWSAIVDREGRLCSAIKVGDAQPYARAIAIAKAGTANGFSSDAFAASTANLYAGAQPGGIIFGYNTTNPFNPKYLEEGTGVGHVVGGVVTSGGGVALYSNGKVIGGLGLAGDTACADHVMAYRMRRAAGLDRIPGGLGYRGTDNIDYADPDQTPTGFKHPHCFPMDIPPGDI
ncbi:MAG TPA: heme-binding protein [Candidatus Manganitrophaceae bacterium]|nr:heme-binding protein [Candidatus Manganitrophaceae bacterium]